MLSGTDRVVMITGASRGIGRALADRLLAGGFRVSAGVRDPSKFAQTDRIFYHRYDAEEPQSADAWVAATLDQVWQSAGAGQRRRNHPALHPLYRG